MTPQWIKIDKTWAEFEPEAESGMVIRLASDPRELVVLGAVNENGGYCDCCTVPHGEIVIAMLDLRETIANAVGSATIADDESRARADDDALRARGAELLAAAKVAP